MEHGDESTDGDSVAPERCTALARLSRATQLLLAELLSSPSRNCSASDPLDALWLVHGLLSSTPSARAAVVTDEGSPIKRQLPFKTYPLNRAITLPTELLDVSMPLNTAIKQRRSRYRFSDRPLDARALSTLLASSYATNRFTTAYGYRRYPMNVAPSAGGLQPVNIYVATQQVENIAPGVYYYHPYRRTLHPVHESDPRPHLARCLGQPEFTYAPVVIVLTCSLDRALWKYSLRHYRAVHIDTGIVAQNLYLVATALELSTCAIAGYHQDEVHQLLAVDGRMEFATLLVAVGHRATKSDTAE